ncbi:uncharacterized protein EMH_0080650 [Eimeria mitis]|uniref:Transmembrane protein n=1 Tax=Eimeria mitis TaxID=44415 RepID=U6K5M9_9EIME|nr:uncharacterized protein EMH_0080650 [Eimeria mitis]CDJ33174.1 hypothetical protein, conserved [Eimeria mitis]
MRRLLQQRLGGCCPSLLLLLLQLLQQLLLLLLLAVSLSSLPEALCLRTTHSSSSSSGNSSSSNSSNSSSSSSLSEPTETNADKPLPLGDEPRKEKWLVPFFILLAFVLGALMTVLIIHCANMRSQRKREAIRAKEAAPEIFNNSDTEAPTPRDRHGIWETPGKEKQQQEAAGSLLVPENSY